MPVDQTIDVPVHEADGASVVPDALRRGTTVITKRFTFDAAHFLPNVADDHKCRRMHGHTYTVWLHVAGPVDVAAGWVTDFGDIKAVWKPLERDLDHHLLNDRPGLENPTAEVLAAWIWARMSQQQVGGAGVYLAAVEVAETPDSKALFVAPGTTAWVPGNRTAALAMPLDHQAQSNGRPVAADAQAEESVVALDPEVVEFAHAHRDPIEDVQSRPDTRGVAIDEVGVTRVRVPVEVLDRDRGRQSTVATLTLGVDLEAEVKGTHLSRFLEAVRDHRDALTLFGLGVLTDDLRRRLGSHRIHVRVEFPYFVTKAAPVTGALGELDYDCAFDVVDVGGELRHTLEIVAPITTLCPCSRDISDYGAHNQRGHVTMKVELGHDADGAPAMVWLEELIDVADRSSSSPLYSVLKRPDERHVTMQAYDNPRFVEDVVREVAVRLEADERVLGYDLRVENDESIHAHNAFARVSRLALS